MFHSKLQTPKPSVIREILSVVAVWIKGQLVIWVSETVMYLAGFAIARTPLWPLLAILCGLASAIPHLGAMFGLLLVLVFSFFGSDGDTWVMVAALAVWAVVQLVAGFVIGPRVLGRKLGLNPWLVFAGGIAGAFIAGPIGILVATPVLAIAGVIWRRTRKRAAQKPPPRV
jgi:predicted PurR-regulated permease PerM